MKMRFRKKRILLLSSIVLVLVLLILDLSIREEEIFEAFGEQFTNEQKTKAYAQAHQGVVTTSEHQLEFPRQDIKEVFLSSAIGNISVKRAIGSAILLQYIVTASASDTDAANRKREAVKVEGQVNNGRLSIVSTAAGRSIDRHSITIDYVLHIPDAVKLGIESEDGSVHVNGIRGDVDVATVSGMLEIVDVEGTLSVKSSYGSTYLSDISGNIGLVNRSSDANIDHIKGNIVVDSQSGRSFISRIEGEVKGNTEYGPVYLREITGAVQMKSRVSDMQLDHIRGNIKITADSGEIKLFLSKEEGYTLDASVSEGRLQTHLPFPIEQLKDEDYRSHMKGVVGNGTWNVELEANSSDIIIHSK
jgi:hypothetical protein